MSFWPLVFDIDFRSRQSVVGSLIQATGTVKFRDGSLEAADAIVVTALKPGSIPILSWCVGCS